MNRRDVIKQVMLGSATLVVLPSALTSCEKEDQGNNNLPGSTLEIDLTLPANSALANTGGFVVVSNIIVVNTGGGNYIALSSICTHQGCTVSYASGASNFQCPCHGSVFAQDGSVVTGPAIAALESYSVSKTGNILTITI